MQALATFFQNILQGLVAMEIPAGSVALLAGALLAAFHVIHWNTLAYTLLFLTIAFTAANIVTAVVPGG